MRHAKRGTERTTSMIDNDDDDSDDDKDDDDDQWSGLMKKKFQFLMFPRTFFRLFRLIRGIRPKAKP